MKKAKTKEIKGFGDAIRAEYDFSGGVRGKHYQSTQAGHTVTVHRADGSTVVKDVKPQAGVVILAPDVRAYFPNSRMVNRALRSLIMLIPRLGGSHADEPRQIRKTISRFRHRRTLVRARTASR